MTAAQAAAEANSPISSPARLKKGAPRPNNIRRCYAAARDVATLVEAAKDGKPDDRRPSSSINRLVAIERR